MSLPGERVEGKTNLVGLPLYWETLALNGSVFCLTVFPALCPANLDLGSLGDPEKMITSVIFTQTNIALPMNGLDSVPQYVP